MSLFVLLALHIFLQGKTYGNLCGKRRPMVPFHCCSKEYEQFCCPFVKRCEDNDNDTSVKRTDKGADRSLLRPICSLPYKSNACFAGFYKGSSGRTLPCPNGFFCPLHSTCLVPCAAGAVCFMASMLTKNSTLNSSALGTKCVAMGQRLDPLFLDGEWVCAGRSTPFICAAGYYCPNASSQFPCPKGFFCKEGSTEPTRCSMLGICGVKQSAPNLYIELSVRVISMALIFAAIYCIKKYKEHFNMCWKKLNGTVQQINPDISANDNLDFLTSHPFTVNVEKRKVQVDIKFRNIKLVLNKVGKPLLDKVNGVFKSRQVTAIMGPSGGGKTTLLNVLSGRIQNGTITGVIKVNGTVVDDLKKYKNMIGVVPQDDIMHEKLTPTEVLTYQARLRLPPRTSKRCIEEKVNNVISLLELQSVKDTVIGNVARRALSGGQRKRVNVGMELVTDPKILLLDEPTSGLDSSASLSVLNSLRYIAEKTNVTIATIIHQPRFEIFNGLHSIILLSTDGRTVCQGSPTWIESHFKRLGYIVPERVNPADFFIDIVSKPGWSTWYYKKSISKSSLSLHPSCHTIRNDTDNDLMCSMKIDLRQSNGFFKQFRIFLSREFLLQQRSIKSIMLDYFLTVVAGAVLGAMYRDIKIQKLMLMATMSSLNVGLTSSLISLRCFNSHRTKFAREASSGINCWSYFMAVNIAQMPHILILPFAYLSLNYTLIHARASFKIYYLVCLVTYLNTSGFAYVISASMSQKSGQMTVVIFVLLSTLLSGSTPSICDLNAVPVIGQLLHSWSYSRWFVEALFEKEAQCLPLAMNPIVDYYRYMNNYSMNNFKLCIFVLFILAITYRMIAGVALLICIRKK